MYPPCRIWDLEKLEIPEKNSIYLLITIVGVRIFIFSPAPFSPKFWQVFIGLLRIRVIWNAETTVLKSH